MSVIKALIAAFSTFSRIPVPSVRLDEKDFKYTLCAFPAIGLVTALLEMIIFKACSLAGLGDILRVCIMCAVPVIVTGGIHLDGYCDTCDAKSSYQPSERKLEILKDPHIGAFGVIRLIVLILFYMAAVSEIKNVAVFGITFVLSRAFTAISVVSLKSAKKTGMGASEKDNSNKKAVSISSVIWILACILTGYMLSGLTGFIASLAMIAACTIIYMLYKRSVYKQFGGFTGDTSGWFLCVMENAMAYVCVLCQMINI